jgi:predicted porin
MKAKFLLSATAALFAATAAAQSSVTIYGLVDLNVSRFSAGANSGTGDLTALVDGGVNSIGSRWGIRTVEDLGGGLKAGVVLEAGFNADNGSAGQGGLAFGRQSFVSLSSATAGEIRLGRQYAPHDVVLVYNNPFGNGLVLNPGLLVTNNGRALPQFIDAPRVNNVIQYGTPTIGNFSAAVQYAPGENTADRFASVMVQYGSNALNAAISHEWNKDRVTGSRTNKVTTVGANYDFRIVKLLAGYQRGRDLTTSAGNVGSLTNLIVTGPSTFTADGLDAYTVGVSVPLGQVLAGVNYTRTNFQSATGQKQGLGNFGVGARYALSPRTWLYSGLSVATGDLRNYILQKRVLQVGVRTAF